MARPAVLQALLGLGEGHAVVLDRRAGLGELTGGGLRPLGLGAPLAECLGRGRRVEPPGSGCQHGVPGGDVGVRGVRGLQRSAGGLVLDPGLLLVGVVDVVVGRLGRARVLVAAAHGAGSVGAQPSGELGGHPVQSSLAKVEEPAVGGLLGLPRVTPGVRAAPQLGGAVDEGAGGVVDRLGVGQRLLGRSEGARPFEQRLEPCLARGEGLAGLVRGGGGVGRLAGRVRRARGRVVQLGPDRLELVAELAGVVEPGELAAALVDQGGERVLERGRQVVVGVVVSAAVASRARACSTAVPTSAAASAAARSASASWPRPTASRWARRASSSRVRSACCSADAASSARIVAVSSARRSSRRVRSSPLRSACSAAVASSRQRAAVERAPSSAVRAVAASASTSSGPGGAARASSSARAEGRTVGGADDGGRRLLGAGHERVPAGVGVGDAAREPLPLVAQPGLDAGVAVDVEQPAEQLRAFLGPCPQERGELALREHHDLGELLQPHAQQVVQQQAGLVAAASDEHLPLAVDELADVGGGRLARRARAALLRPLPLR